MPEFVKDVEELRRRAINRIEEGPVTGAYQLDKDRTIHILNDALATEIVCVLRYMHHYFMATGVHGKSVAAEFKEHADAERNHADAIAERIQQLGGKPDYNPGSLVKRSASQYVEGHTLGDMIREDLIAERVVIELYTDMVRYFGDKDPTTRVLLEGLLADEEEHAADLSDLLYIVDPQTGEAEGQDPGTHPLDFGRQPGGEEGRMRSDQTRKQVASSRESGQAHAGQPRPEGTKRTPQGAEPFAGRGTVQAEPNAQGEMRPARSIGKPSADDRNTGPVPGVTGRPTRRGEQIEEEDSDVAEDANAGAHTGTSRSVHVTRPNRKKRIA